MTYARGRFTLIELLVVIAIIAILASLLLPALTLARAKAVSVRCTGNLKNLNMALSSYASDNDGAYPRGTQLTYGTAAYYPGVRYYDSWIAYLMVYTGDATEANASRCAGTPIGVWHCGAFNTYGSGNYGYRYTNYNINGETLSDTLKSKNYPSRPEFWRCPETILSFTDAKDNGNGTNSTSFAGDDAGRQRVSPLHNEMFNGAFIDGHVASITPVWDKKGIFGIPVEMGVYGYPNASYASQHLGRTLQRLW